jgi:Flp pilus assembly protein TadD
VRRPVAIALLAAAVALVYANALGGGFVFDDFPAIPDNPHVRSLLPLSSSLDAPPEVTTAGRPVAAFSFAVNYAQGGGETWWFHTTNVAIHLAAALTLFGVARRTLLTPPLNSRFRTSSTTVAFFAALVWAVHPLNTQAVTYIVQRVESLMGLFLLLTLYFSIRGISRLQAEMLAVVFCALGMATKQTMVGAPLIVIAWDYLFAGRLRWKFYAALASTWILLAFLVVHDARPHSVGSFEGWTPGNYLLTQGGVILHYLRLAAVPHPLVFDYDWPPAAGWRAVVPPVVVFALLAATVFGLARRRAWAFAGVVFFVVLAPSSSVLPVVTEVAAEHRMYVPLAALVSLAVAAAWAWRPRGRALTAIAGSIAIAFGGLTVVRNRAYASDETIWADTIARHPSNARAHHNYAVDLLQAGHVVDAEEHARIAVSLQPGKAEGYRTHGIALLQLGRRDEGVVALERARAIDPQDAKTLQNLGEAYGAKGEMGPALAAFLGAARLAPDDPFILNRAGWILATAENPALRDGQRALQLASHAVEVTQRRDVTSLDTLAAAYAALGQFDRAVVAGSDALELARRRGDAAMVPELQQRLALYRERAR